MTGYDRLFEECENSIDFYTNHLISLRKNIVLQEKAITMLLRLNPETDLSDFNELEKFNNYNGYITIAMLDLAVNLKNLIKSKTEWEKAFFIKNSFLIIHETTKKLKPFKGKSFVQITVENKYKELNDVLKNLYNEIDDFRNAPTYNKISKTRHSIAGHIEESLKSYYDTVKELDGEEAGNLISKFMNILNKALNLTTDLAIAANNKQKEKNESVNSEILLKLNEIKNILKK
ncbi:hypothetical protein LNQ81_11520 [Myroides sp. M-43]|uniref:hypothetical protein n=1 Tax=Myroides oncorhynchi TaxID=2893756 RepID=UPI001E4E2849|nr:hypothetical protein [Myroides oncorhynchi]MCC9043300.1 hypothetical protein [Myroides oncorhynchi]